MTPNELLTLERRISAERFAPYRAAVGDDLKWAVRLYERNTELSAAFWAVLSDLEILVRNAMHEKLTAWSVTVYGQTAWYLDLHLLRNRIAHHDPIHNRPLIRLHSQAMAMAGWVCPITRQWIAARSRVPALLSEWHRHGMVTR